MAYQITDKDGNPIKHEGKEVTASDSLGVVKSVNLDKRTLRILATDETRDRDGDIISMKGWNFDNFIKNPVFLWSHDYSSVPLAASIKIERKRSPARLLLTHKFPSAGVHPFADMILQLYHERVINAGSVGFFPSEWEEIKNDEEGESGWSNRRFLKQELLEHSGCAVPANPNAVQESISRAMKEVKFEYDDKVKLFKAVNGEEQLELDEAAKTAVEEELAGLIDKGPTFEEETAVQVQVPDDISETSDPLALAKYIVYEDGKVEEVNEDADWKEVDSNKLLQDNYKGLQDIFEEIFSELLADSLAAELADYRKRVNALLKVGAVLNMKNKELLKQASENILRVLKNAGADSDAEDDDSTQVSLETDEEEVTRFDAILNDETDITIEQNVETRGEVVKVKKVIPLKRGVTQEQVDQVTKNFEEMLSQLISM